MSVPYGTVRCTVGTILQRPHPNLATEMLHLIMLPPGFLLPGCSMGFQYPIGCTPGSATAPSDNDLRREREWLLILKACISGQSQWSGVISRMRLNLVESWLTSLSSSHLPWCESLNSSKVKSGPSATVELSRPKLDAALIRSDR